MSRKRFTTETVVPVGPTGASAFTSSGKYPGTVTTELGYSTGSLIDTYDQYTDPNDHYTALAQITSTIVNCHHDLDPRFDQEKFTNAVYEIVHSEVSLDVLNNRNMPRHIAVMLSKNVYKSANEEQNYHRRKLLVELLMKHEAFMQPWLNRVQQESDSMAKAVTIYRDMNRFLSPSEESRIVEPSPMDSHLNTFIDSLRELPKATRIKIGRALVHHPEADITIAAYESLDERAGRFIRWLYHNDSLALIPALRAVSAIDPRRQKVVDQLFKSLSDQEVDKLVTKGMDPAILENLRKPGNTSTLVEAMNLMNQGATSTEIEHYLRMKFIGSTPTHATLLDNPRTTLMQYGAFAAQCSSKDPNQSLSELILEVASNISKATVRKLQSDQLSSMSQSKDEQNTLILAAEYFAHVGLRWAQAGFPTVVPTHRLAASLMGTSIPADLVTEVTLPWRSFCVLLPDGLLPKDGPLGGCQAIWVVEGEGAQGKLHAVIAFPRGTLHHEVQLVFEFQTAADLVAVSSLDKTASVLVELIGRLVLGTAIELDQPKFREAIAKGPPPEKEGRKDKEPRSWTFELRRDVKVDLRPWVRDYIRGGGKSPSVQVLVRGHHKRQVCGKGGLDRRWIHVEAYWRGPEDAPIAVRSHVVVEKEPS